MNGSDLSDRCVTTARTGPSGRCYACGVRRRPPTSEHSIKWPADTAPIEPCPRVAVTHDAE